MTKKEYVSGSETDEESEEKAAPVPPKKVEKVGLTCHVACRHFFQNPNFQVEPPVAKKPKLTGSGAAKGQTGIMNFFKKK